MMFIVVEGADGVGKTTLCNEMAKQLDHDVARYHFGPPVRHPFLEYEADFDSYHPDDDKHIIVDRLHWGEMIYGPLYRGKSLLGTAGIDHIDRYLLSRGAVLVFMDGELEVVRARLKERGETYLRDGDLETVLLDYRELAHDSFGWALWKDGTHLEPGELARMVIRLAKHQALKACDLSVKFPTYVGPFKPTLLLLGERRKDLNHAAAFVPYQATSGRFLSEALYSTKLRPAVGFANATEVDVRALVQRLGTPKVCALGQVAHKVCEATGVSHSVVPHPQYARRFLHSKKRAYGRLITHTIKYPGDYGAWKGEDIV